MARAKNDEDDLTAALAERVFGWRNVHRHEGELMGKKPDKLGRYRTAKVPDYAGNPIHASAIDEQMKQLKKDADYLKALARIAGEQELPVEWATPAQRVKAALAVVQLRRKR